MLDIIVLVCERVHCDKSNQAYIRMMNRSYSFMSILYRNGSYFCFPLRCRKVI